MEHPCCPVETILDELRQTLPPVFSRSEAARLLPGLVKPGSLANEDSAGTGPADLFYVGRRACYRREPFLEWLRPKITSPRRRGRIGGKK